MLLAAGPGSPCASPPSPPRPTRRSRMRRRLDQLLPAVVFLGFLGAAVVLNLLLSSAQDRGVEALEESTEAEVQAIARSQNQSFASQLQGTSSLFSNETDPYELVPGST